MGWRTRRIYEFDERKKRRKTEQLKVEVDLGESQGQEEGT
jgi:hypothetical protein